MRYFIFIIFSLISIKGLSQNKTQLPWQPQVIDKNTKIPLTEATISVNKREYYSVNKNGFAEIPLFYFVKGDTIYVSLIGYQPLKIIFDNPEKLPLKLELQPLVYQLAAVEIKQNKDVKELIVGSNASVKTQPFFISNNTQYALYVNNIEKHRGYIKEVYIKMNNRAGAINMPFKLTLFDKLKNSVYPNYPLMDEIIIQNTSEKRWFKIDLLHLKIKIPENGFFIVFSTLSEKYYSNKKHYIGFSAQDKVPGLELTILPRDMNKDNYSLTKTNYPGWNLIKSIEYQMQAKLLLTDD